MDLKLSGKTALITGSSIGIGAAIADALAAEGVNLVMCARGEERLNTKADAIRAAHGVQVLTVAGDVAKADDCDRIIAQAKATFATVDILINNAGTGSEETIMNATDDKWQYYWDLHVMAAIRLTRGGVPLMREAGSGVILNNASICASQPLWYEPIYNTTKAALVMLSKNMANEFIKDNIRVNAVNPGLVLTPDWMNTARLLTADTDQTPEEYLDKIAKDSAPIGRFATPEEIADFFVFMCSDRSSYAVGATFYVDGGWLNTIT